MLLEYDKIAQVKEIAREIAKEETEAMGKALEAEIKDIERIVKALETRITNLEREIRDLKEEIKRAKELKPKTIDQSKKYK